MSGHVLSQGIFNLMNPGLNPTKMEEPSELVFASFNQDTTSLAVGTTSGYKLYSLTSTDSLDPIYSNGMFIDSVNIKFQKKTSQSYMIIIFFIYDISRKKIDFFKNKFKK